MYKRIFKTVFASLVILPLTALHSTALYSQEQLLVVDPIVVETPPGVSVAAGFMTLVNEGKDDIVITSAYSSTIKKVELHLSQVENDVASMTKQETVTIKAGETLKLQHGGLHIMLMALDKPLKTGDKVDIILETNLGPMLIDMPVARLDHAQHSMTKSEHETMHGDSDMKLETMQSKGENAMETMHGESDKQMEAMADDKMIKKSSEVMKHKHHADPDTSSTKSIN